MDTLELDAWLMFSIVLLVSFGKLVHVLFRTLRTCIREYYDFRDWLSHFRQQPGNHDRACPRAPD